MKKKKKERIAYFDNARIILVTLVVFGHLISPLRNEHEILYYLNNALATFRMPALILLTGFFSKGFLKEGYIKKMFLRVLVPFFILQYVFGFYYHVILETKSSLAIDPLRPQFAMWFFLSLFFWHLLLYIFTHFKRPILVAVLLSLFLGAIDSVGHYASISRTIVFFPLFLIGHYAKKEHFEVISSKFAKRMSLLLVAIFILFQQFVELQSFRRLMLGRYGYDALDMGNIEGVFFRLLAYVIMIIGSLIFFAWVPKKRYFFTKLGARTAFVYAIHIFFVQYIKQTSWFGNISGLEYLYLPVLAMLIAWFATTKPVMFLTKPLVTFENPFRKK